MTTEATRPAPDAAIAAASGADRTVRAQRGGSGRVRLSTGILLAIVALAAAVVGSLFVGAEAITPAALWQGGHPDHGIMVARLERTGLGLVIGAVFGLAGTLMQGLTRNPLADPGILGITAGSAFLMVVGIAFLGASTLGEFIWFGFAGAAIAAVAVHLIASSGREGATPAKIAMAGAALTVGLSGWTTGVLLVSRETVEQIRRWQVGTVGGRSFDDVLTALPFFAVGVVLAVLSARILNALALGDDLARGLGRRTGLDRMVVGLAIVLLAGAGTAVAGPITFLGLVVPHLVRSQVGPDYTRIVPLSAVWGAAIVVAADTVGRVVLPPGEIQVGVMTAVLGVPVFLWMIRRGRMGAL